ncbi:hypothetical protein ACP70R_022810 [Stipagrostis hirtigluma subsp. patula]
MIASKAMGVLLSLLALLVATTGSEGGHATVAVVTNEAKVSMLEMMEHWRSVLPNLAVPSAILDHFRNTGENKEKSANGDDHYTNAYAYDARQVLEMITTLTRMLMMLDKRNTGENKEKSANGDDHYTNAFQCSVSTYPGNTGENKEKTANGDDHYTNAYAYDARQVSNGNTRENKEKSADGDDQYTNAYAYGARQGNRGENKEKSADGDDLYTNAYAYGARQGNTEANKEKSADGDDHYTNAYAYGSRQGNTGENKEKYADGDDLYSNAYAYGAGQGKNMEDKGKYKGRDERKSNPYFYGYKQHNKERAERRHHVPLFSEDALTTPGSTVNPFIPRAATWHTPLMRRDIADSIPMSRKNFFDILAMFAPASLSMAGHIWSTLDICENPPKLNVQSKEHGCATSIESMIEIAGSALGTTRDLLAFSSVDVPAEGIPWPSEAYTVAVGMAMGLNPLGSAIPNPDPRG